MCYDEATSCERQAVLVWGHHRQGRGRLHSGGLHETVPIGNGDAATVGGGRVRQDHVSARAVRGAGVRHGRRAGGAEAAAVEEEGRGGKGKGKGKATRPSRRRGMRGPQRAVRGLQGGADDGADDGAGGRARGGVRQGGGLTDRSLFASNPLTLRMYHVARARLRSDFRCQCLSTAVSRARLAGRNDNAATVNPHGPGRDGCQGGGRRRRGYPRRRQEAHVRRAPASSASARRRRRGLETRIRRLGARGGRIGRDPVVGARSIGPPPPPPTTTVGAGPGPCPGPGPGPGPGPRASSAGSSRSSTGAVARRRPPPPRDRDLGAERKIGGALCADATGAGAATAQARQRRRSAATKRLAVASAPIRRALAQNSASRLMAAMREISCRNDVRRLPGSSATAPRDAVRRAFSDDHPARARRRGGARTARHLQSNIDAMREERCGGVGVGVRRASAARASVGTMAEIVRERAGRAAAAAARGAGLEGRGGGGGGGGGGAAAERGADPRLAGVEAPCRSSVRG